MPAQRRSSHLTAVAGEHKKGETEARSKRLTSRSADVAKPPRPLPSSARPVWDRLAPKLHQRGLLNEENTDLLWSYCVTVAQNAAAAAALFDRSGKPLPMVAAARSDRAPVKNPAQQVFRDTAATMRQLAGALHLDELGIGKEPANGGKRGASRLLSSG